MYYTYHNEDTVEGNTVVVNKAEAYSTRPYICRTCKSSHLRTKNTTVMTPPIESTLHRREKDPLNASQSGLFLCPGRFGTGLLLRLFK